MDIASVEETITGATSKVAGFIQHYGSELLSLTGILGTVSAALPIDAQDKGRVTDVLAELEAAANRAIEGANAVTGELGGTVVVDKSDVAAAIADYFASDAGKAALAAAVAGNANAGA